MKRPATATLESPEISAVESMLGLGLMLASFAMAASVCFALVTLAVLP
jgi:hypothetical protein